MRRNPDIISSEASIKPQQALLPRNLLEAIHHRLVRQLAIRARLLLLQPRLDKIKRQGEETCEKAGNRARSESLCLSAETGALEPLFGLGEEG